MLEVDTLSLKDLQTELNEQGTIQAIWIRVLILTLFNDAAMQVIQNRLRKNEYKL
jgi:hypothetical protein